MRVFREPCYFAEAVYLLYYFVNEVSYEEEFARICKCYCRKADEEEEGMMRRIQELTRVSRVVTADLDRESPKLRHYFEKLPGLEKRPDCCLAQVMLVSIPLDCSDVDAFAAQLLEAYTCMFQEGIKINDLNGMGLVVERQDAQEETESLMVQLERLPCSIEGRWTILRALTEFETHLKELTELIRPVAAQLQTEMATLCAMNAEPLAQCEAYFRDHTVDDFQNEMFNTTFLFTETNVPHEIWLGVWSFNPFGTWSEWLTHQGQMVRLAYLGANISFRFATNRKVHPDAEAMSGMLRALGGKDKLEILRRCAEQPCSAAKLAAEMNVNSGIVSRNLYGLFKMGYLETRGDGERVNYITRLDNLEQVFHWVAEYIGGIG